MDESLVVLIVILLFSAVAGFETESPKNHKRSCNQENDGKDKNSDKLSTYASSETIEKWNNLSYEFDNLFTEIAHYKARAAGKLSALAEAEAGLSKEKEISPEDVDAAFLEAIRELQLTELGCGVACDRKPLLERIKELRKRYELQTP